MRIGVDIGGMTVKIGLVEETDYRIIDKKVIPTDSEKQSASALIRKIAEAVKTILQENGISVKECKALGIACPGTVDSRNGAVLYSNNLGWEDLALCDILRQELDLPMAVANDADAAALGEVICGAAKGRNNAVLLTLGTGVGGGVIMDKRIFSGYLQGGCELGHMVIERQGRLCTCGRRGCLEVYASASALMEQARNAAAADQDSVLNALCGHDYAALNGKMVFDAQKQGDKAAMQVVDEYEESLSIGIANIVNIFRPEVVILGGGVSAQKEYLTDELQKRVSMLCFGREHGEIPPIVTSALGNDAGIIGAAYLVQI